MGHGINPYHEIRDRAKVEEIAASMMVNGWVGAPIVVDGFEGITGVHRLAAADLVNEWYESYKSDRQIEVPTIDIREVWDLAGMTESIDDYLTYETCDEYVIIADMLPAAIREEYGIDVH